MDMNRRKFIGRAAAAAATIVVTPLALAEPAAGEERIATILSHREYTWSPCRVYPRDENGFVLMSELNKTGPHRYLSNMKVMVDEEYLMPEDGHVTITGCWFEWHPTCDGHLAKFRLPSGVWSMP